MQNEVLKPMNDVDASYAERIQVISEEVLLVLMPVVSIEKNVALAKSILIYSLLELIHAVYKPAHIGSELRNFAKYVLANADHFEKSIPQEEVGPKSSSSKTKKKAKKAA